MKKLILIVAIAALAAPQGSSATTLFSSADIHRPLVPQTIPEQDVFRRLYPELSRSALSRTHEEIKHARKFFAVTEINDGNDWVWISELLEAARLNPRDPYAPCLLGAYLALHHKLEAAAEATRDSLRLLQAAEPAAGGAFGDLHLRCGINLARYRLLLGDAAGALDELSALSTDTAEGPLPKKAYWWLSALALAEVGQPDTGRRALEEAKSVDSRAALKQARLLSPLWAESTAYPQYFKDAGTVEAYLDAILLGQEGRRSEAISTLRKAVGEWRKFYDARTALAVFLADSDQPADVAEAAAMLEKLRDAPIEGKMMRSETISYNLAKIRADQGKLETAADLYRAAIRQTVERNCAYFRKMASLEEAQGCDLAETCRGLSSGEPSRCSQSCDSYAGPAGASSSPAWFCHSLQGERFVAAHNNLGDVYLRQAAKGGDGKEAWLRQALYQFQFALGGAEVDSEMWHRVNLNLARTHLERHDREGFAGTLGEGLRQQSSPVLVYLSLLETAGLTDSPASAARLYLDVVEDAWEQAPPPQVRTQLETLAAALDGPELPAEDRLLASRARRLLQPESSAPLAALATLSPFAAGTEQLRQALIREDEGAGRSAVSQVQAACPDLLRDAGSCGEATQETSRDALFLYGRWYLGQGDKARALEYFEAAAKVDPAWPLSRRYIEQLQGAR